MIATSSLHGTTRGVRLPEKGNQNRSLNGFSELKSSRRAARARGGIAAIARKAKLTREATYKMLSNSGNPELRSLTSVLRATGLRISVKAVEKKAA